MASGSNYTSFHSDRFENAEHLQRIKKLHNRLHNLRLPKRTKRRLKRRQSELQAEKDVGGLPTIVSSPDCNGDSNVQWGHGQQQGPGQQQGQRHVQQLEQRSQSPRRQLLKCEHENTRQRDGEMKHVIPVRDMAGRSIAHKPSARSSAMACSPPSTSRAPALPQDRGRAHQPRPPEQQRTRALSWRGRLLQSEQLDEHERAMQDYERELRTQQKRNEAAVVLRARMRDRQRELAAKRAADHARLEAEERVRQGHAREQKKLRDQRRARMAARARQRNEAKQQLLRKETGWDDTPPHARQHRTVVARGRRDLRSNRRKGCARPGQALPPGRSSQVRDKNISKAAASALPAVACAPARASKSPSLSRRQSDAIPKRNQQQQKARQRNHQTPRRAQNRSQNAEVAQQRERASRLIQANHRGRSTRRQVAHGRASRLIQAQYRGRKARQRVNGLKAQWLEEEAQAAEATQKVAEAKQRAAEAKQKAAEDRIAAAEARAAKAKQQAAEAKQQAAEAKQQAAEAKQQAAEAKQKAAEDRIAAAEAQAAEARQKAEERIAAAEAQAAEAKQKAAEDMITAANAIAEAEAEQKRKIEEAQHEAACASSKVKRKAEDDRQAAAKAIAEVKAARMQAASEQMVNMINKMRHSALGRALRKWQDETALAAARAELEGKGSEENEWEAELGELFVDEEQIAQQAERSRAASEQMVNMINKMRHSALGRALRKWQDETALAAARAEAAASARAADEEEYYSDSFDDDGDVLGDS